MRRTQYVERLIILYLTSVEERIRWGDLIETFRIVILDTSMCICAGQFFDRNQDSNTRRHQLKLKTRTNKTRTRMKVFSNRAAPVWNRLPQDIVLSKTTN